MSWSHWPGHEAMSPEDWALENARRRVAKLERQLAEASTANARMRRELNSVRSALRANGVHIPQPYETCEQVLKRMGIGQGTR